MSTNPLGSKPIVLNGINPALAVDLKQRAEMDDLARRQADISLRGYLHDEQRLIAELALMIPPNSLAMLAARIGHLVALNTLTRKALEHIRSQEPRHADVIGKIEKVLDAAWTVGAPPDQAPKEKP